MSLTIGTRLGSFEITEAIGAGGMGEVFRARDRTLGRDVAIKVLPTAFAADPERRQRFAREARLLAALNHPHIAQVFGVEEYPGGSAIVMELVPGQTLREIERQRTVSTRDALAYAREIALALDAAHEKGIIHRDLKPANIKVTPEGTVKVLDFGLAKAWMTDAGAPDDQTTMGGQTAACEVVGTIAYMSPEQARAQPVDRRTDIWAFGCVLFELFSGRRPFDGATASDTITAVLEREPDWQALPATTPVGVRQLIQRCLEKDRRLRLRDIGDGLPSLADPSSSDAAALRGVDLPPTSVSARSRAAIAVLAVLAAVLGITTVRLWLRSNAPSPSAGERPVRFELAPPPGALFGSGSGIESTTVAFSPDGTRLAFVANLKGKAPQLWIRPLDAEESRALPGTEGASSAFWSPDGRTLGFFAGGKLKRIDPAGGAAVLICPVPLTVGLSGTWGADGDILFASIQGDGIFRVSAGGGTSATAIARSESRKRVLWPRFLPDGRRFIYTWLGDRLTGEIVLVEADGRERSLVPALSQAQFVEPDWLLTVREATLVAQRVDLSAARPVGEPVSIVGPIPYSTATGWADVTASPNGMIALQSHIVVSRILTISGTGQVEGPIGPPGKYLAVRVSPDGSALLFSRTRPELGTFDIWVTTFGRQDERPVTTSPGMETGEAWMPGMREIVMAATEGGTPNIRLRDLATGKERPLLESLRFQSPTDVSPDGKIVVYEQRTVQGNWDLMQVPIADPTRAAPLFATSFSESDLRFSPNGRQVAFVSDESGRMEVYVAPFPVTRSATMVSMGGGGTPRWHRDGSGLYFLSTSGELMSVPIDASGRPATPTPRFNAGTWRDFDVMPDGTRFVAIVSQTTLDETVLTVLLNWQRVIASR